MTQRVILYKDRVVIPRRLIRREILDAGHQGVVSMRARVAGCQLCVLARD